jgi:hypothetical protein
VDDAQDPRGPNEDGGGAVRMQASTALPWWDLDPLEVPVPLVEMDQAGDHTEPSSVRPVEEAADASGRLLRSVVVEDTDGLPPGLRSKDRASRVVTTARSPHPVVGGGELSPVAGLLAAGCVVMFALGWLQGSAIHQGSRAVATSPLTAVSGDVAESTPDRDGEGSNEGQQRSHADQRSRRTNKEKGRDR